MVLGMDMSASGLEAAFTLPYSTTWIHQTPESHQSASGGATVSTDSTATSDDWNKDRSQPSSSATASTSAIDISSSLIDMQAMASSSTPSTSVQALYHSYSPPLSAASSYFTPYGMMSYSQPWSQVPLSSYSSLNGATSSAPSNQPSQRSPTMQPMVIDPTLTMNSTPQSYGGPPSSPPPVHTSAFQHQFQSQPQMSINPNMFMHQPSHSQRTLTPSALHSPSLMNTMAQPVYYPLHSHSHTPTPTTTSTPSSSSTPTPAPSTQESKQRFQDALKGLLVPTALTGEQAVRGIVAALNSFGPQDVDAGTRLEVLTKIRDNAGNTFFSAWAGSTDAMDILREWLKAGATGKDDGAWEDTIMPLLHVIDRLPLSIEQLKASKLGKIIVKLMKEPPSPAIKDMASNIERKWRQLVAAASETVKKQDSVTGDEKTKKRKLSELSSSKAAPPPKKPSVAAANTATTSKVAQVKPKVVTTTVKDAKSDSSFFSAPKPKPKLPSFKKAPPVSSSTTTGSTMVKREPDGNVAQPSSIDPFQEVLKSMTKGRMGSPATSAPTAAANSAMDTSASNTPVADSISATDGPRKKRKTVTWAANGQLEQVRLIERAIYDDDPVDGIYSAHSIRDLERGEGAALHAHLFEELIDWYEPPVIGLPPELESTLRPRGVDSQEKFTQEEREKTALSSLYVSNDQIPDTPTEPSSQVLVEETDANVKTMIAGVEIQPFFSHATSVADLVSQLRSTGPPPNDISGMGTAMDGVMGYSTPAGGVGQGQGDGLRGLGLDPNALSLLAQHLALNGYSTAQLQQQITSGGVAPPVAAGQGFDQTQNQNQWGAYTQQPQQQQPFSDFGGFGNEERDRDERDAPRGRGTWRGRGRGRGDSHGPSGGAPGFRSRRKPCTFYAQGRCKFGDACDFSHESPAAYY